MVAKAVAGVLKWGRSARERRPPRSSAQWREYFRRNAASLLEIPWELGVRLTESERAAIAASIQQFQLGESSDGDQFLARGREYARVSGDVQYLPALRRFIAEEQRHGRDLGRFMDLADIPRIRRAWADTVFRWLRHTSGLERSIMVLVTAEVIAQVYYDALRDATRSIVLRQLCNQILRDEEEHVRFQCERLAILRRDRVRWVILLKQSIHRAFMAVTCLVFWWKHGKAVRTGGYGLFAFLRSVRRHFRHALIMADPRHYSFAETVTVAIVTPPAATAEFEGKWLEL
jgi:hypothetical protein